ncbi:hypothetical protein BO82DRAFT_251734, partial [Aspergillus uvarum CBS 121591]
DISHLIQNELLCSHAENISSRLTQDALLKLSLLAWHFDSNGSVSQDLRHFIWQPQAGFTDVCKTIWSQYNNRSKYPTSLRRFKKEMFWLLTNLEGAF